MKASQQGFDGNVQALRPYYSPSDLNLQNKDGSTALHLACENGHAGVVKSLLAMGINYEIKDKKGRTAREVAKLNHHQAAADLIVRGPRKWFGI